MNNKHYAPEEKLEGHRIGVTLTKGKNVIVFNRVSDGGWRQTWLHEEEALDLRDWLNDTLFDTTDDTETENYE